MKIELGDSFASDGKAEEYDVRQLKKALNRLGYYTPFEKTGITGIPDKGLFDAIKTFQKDQGLMVTGRVKPDDLTVAMLNSVLERVPDGQYIWRTVVDGNVRKEHAQHNRQVRLWSYSPDPGEDFNCRCWAKVVKDLDSHKATVEHSVSKSNS